MSVSQKDLQCLVDLLELVLDGQI